MNIQPLKDNILVVPEKAEDKSKTESGLYLPESAEGSDEKPQIGKVLAVGDSKKIEVKKGQKVIYNRYSGTEVKMDGDDLLIVKNDDVLAVIEN